MQAYFLQRGEYYETQKFEEFLRTRFVNWVVEHNATGKKINNPVAIGVRDVKLKEIFFPKENADTIFNTFKFGKEHLYPNNWKMQTCIAGLRKMLQAKKIPDFKRDKVLLMPKKVLQNIQIIPIGYREDAIYEDNNGFKTEAI